MMINENLMAKLAVLRDKYRELENRLSDPAAMQNMITWQKLSREHSSLQPIARKIDEYDKICAELRDNEELSAQSDAEMKKLIADTTNELLFRKGELEKEMPLWLLPKDKNDDKNVIMEIRGGVGGEEAALFAGDLFRMYSRYAARSGWKTELLSANATEIGGFKEVSFIIEGAGAYSRLKFESGAHRVQRIPVTESGGRIHTSAVTVAVLPEADEIDIHIDPGDLRIDTYCAGGAGGQYVNRTETAIRITHLPTGIVAQCQDEKSQLKNKEKAMKVLLARVNDKAQQEQQAQVAADRKNQVGSGDRSERIRTYNFPQGRVTDHRVGLTLHKLSAVLDGDLDDIINELQAAERAERLKQI